MDPVWRDKVEEWGDKAYEETGIESAFNMRNPAVEKHLKDFSSSRIKKINDTTRDAVRQALSDGAAEGEGIPELSRRVRDVFDTASRSRSVTIARTEVLRSSNFASLEGYKQSGVVQKKQWLATPDDRTRDLHAELGDRDPIDIDDDFEVGGYSAQSPGDSGEPEFDINCRCTVVPVIDDVDEKHLSGARWKRFDKRLKAWEGLAEDALRRAFDKQRDAVLKVLSRRL